TKGTYQLDGPFKSQPHLLPYYWVDFAAAPSFHLFASPNWRVGATVTLSHESGATNAWGVRPNIRYYFQPQRSNGFWFAQVEGAYEETTWASAGGFPNYETRLGVGYNYFLSTDLALEIKTEYVNRLQGRFEESPYTLQQLVLTADLQPFFRVAAKKPIQGLMEQGNFVLSDNFLQFIKTLNSTAWSADISPALGYFPTNRLLVGGQLKYKILQLDQVIEPFTLPEDRTFAARAYFFYYFLSKPKFHLGLGTEMLHRNQTREGDNSLNRPGTKEVLNAYFTSLSALIPIQQSFALECHLRYALPATSPFALSDEISLGLTVQRYLRR
ncbi:MAG: hypothetical protein AAF840_01645, partial [Bacteroidota bacterium]